MPPPPAPAAAALSPASPAPITLSSWFLDEADARTSTGAGAGPPRAPYYLCVIILNHGLPPRLTPALLARADLVVCADGGANRLFADAPGWVGAGDADAEQPDDARARFLPSAIVGDLDSLSPAAASYYASAGVPIVDGSADQDTTDLEKALAYVHAAVTGGGREWGATTVIALGALGGRLDHTLSAINALWKPVEGAWAPNLVLVGDGGSLARAVPTGAGAVAIEPAAREAGGHCGLVALGPPLRVVTSGLAWDLGTASPPLAVGGLQSTSNRVVGRGEGGQPRVVVDASGGGGGGGRLLWTSEAGL